MLIGRTSTALNLALQSAALAVLLLAARTAAQSTLFGPEQVFDEGSTDGVFKVLAADLDGDGDTDVIFASFTDDKIAWFENTDGMGSFGAQQVITTTATLVSQLFIADLNGDGNLDILSNSVQDFGGQNGLAWYENSGQAPYFGLPRGILTSEGSAGPVHVADLDGDTDMDVLMVTSSGVFFTTEILLFENIDGTGSFGPEQVVIGSGGSNMFTADLDGDGDLDLLSDFTTDVLGALTTWWYDNDGAGSFLSAHRIGAAWGTAISAADLDGDGDIDVISGVVDVGQTDLSDRIEWYENTDGLGLFGPGRIISLLTDYPRSVVTADLDGDGDIDVLSASSDDNKIAWYENTDGKGSFGPQHVISATAQGAESVVAADLDGDGRIDVLSSSTRNSKIAWYRNLGPPLGLRPTWEKYD